MKIYIHIFTENEFMDYNVMTEAECDGAPRPGDVFHMNDHTAGQLEAAIAELGWPEIRNYSSWIYGQKGGYYIDIDDCIYVCEVAWKPSRTIIGKYECHISLNSIKDEREWRSGVQLTKEDYDQIMEARK